MSGNRPGMKYVAERLEIEPFIDWAKRLRVRAKEMRDLVKVGRKNLAKSRDLLGEIGGVLRDDERALALEEFANEVDYMIEKNKRGRWVSARKRTKR